MRRKHEAERDLIHEVLRDALSRERLLDHVEAVDRDGDQYALDELARLTELLERHAKTLGVRRRFIIEGLRQPSVIGRERYAKKLVERAESELQAAGR